jgi:hypothetical protein
MAALKLFVLGSPAGEFGKSQRAVESGAHAALPLMPAARLQT